MTYNLWHVENIVIEIKVTTSRTLVLFDIFSSVNHQNHTDCSVQLVAAPEIKLGMVIKEVC